MQILSSCRVVAELADEVPVVQDVVVRERRALREAGGPRGVLDVDRVVGAQLDRAERAAVRAAPGLEQRVPLAGTEQDDLLQSGAARPDLGDHRGVVGRLQPLRGDEQSGARLVQHELELAGPVGGVDVHQDRADLRGGVLGQHPFGAVRGPDAHPVPHGDAGGEQAERERVHVGGEFGVAPPAAGRHVDQGRAIGEPAHCRVEVLPDRVAEQRRVADGRRVALLRHGVLLSPLRAS